METIDACLNTKLDIKENLAYLINLLVERVEVEKINGDRKNIRLKVYYDFNMPNIDIDLDMNENNQLKGLSSKNLACRRDSSALKCCHSNTKQPWVR